MTLHTSDSPPTRNVLVTHWFLGAAAVIVLCASIIKLISIFYPLRISTQELVHNASSALVSAERENKSENRIALLCKSLSSAGEALSRDPHDGRHLMGWAHIRALLDDTECPDPFTKGDPDQALEEALALSPLDPDVLISGAQYLSLRAKEKESWELIRKALTFDDRLTSTERSSLATLLRTPDAVQAAVPSQFPQVITWAPFLLDSPSPLVQALVPNLQQKALSSLEESVKAGTVPIEIAREHLENLYQNPLADTVRRQADTLAAEIFRKENVWSIYRFVDFRKKLSLTNALVGYTPLDKRPEASSISYWDRPTRIRATAPRVSIGVALSEPKELTFLELIFVPGSKAIPLNMLKLFVSNDNLSWNEIGVSGGALISSLGKKLHEGLLLPKGIKARYWKIYYSGDGKNEATISAPEGMLVYSEVTGGK